MSQGKGRKALQDSTDLFRLENESILAYERKLSKNRDAAKVVVAKPGGVEEKKAEEIAAHKTKVRFPLKGNQ